MVYLRKVRGKCKYFPITDIDMYVNQKYIFLKAILEYYNTVLGTGPGGRVSALGNRRSQVRSRAVTYHGTSCFSLGTQTYGVELGLVDPVSG